MNLRFFRPGSSPSRVERIGRLDFKAADAALLHDVHFAFEFRLGDRRPEPPPAHHDPRVVRRLIEAVLKLIDVRGKQRAGGEQCRSERGRGEGFQMYLHNKCSVNSAGDMPGNKWISANETDFGKNTTKNRARVPSYGPRKLFSASSPSFAFATAGVTKMTCQKLCLPIRDNPFASSAFPSSLPGCAASFPTQRTTVAHSSMSFADRCSFRARAKILTEPDPSPLRLFFDK